MTLPSFPLHEDPGPDFYTLVRRVDGPEPSPGGDVAEKLHPPHGTTCVALRYDEGVVIAGDRRATSGNRISHRTIEKVFAADRHSAVAIAGAAGPAIEMVKLFQLQLEHYEKVEGRSLSLNGKANQLGGMLRQNLPMAMQGMAVVPIFAGYDLREDAGRLFAYDVTGGRYEEREFAATGSGSLHAGTVIKLQWRRDQSRDDAINVALAALFEAADEDSATGGPDLIREIFPVVATITADGFERVDDAELAAKYEKIIADLKEREVPA